MQAAEERLARYILSAPSDGLILHSALTFGVATRKPQLGDVVWGGESVLSVCDVSRMAASIRVREVDWPRVELGMPARVTPVAFMHTNIEAAVSAIDPSATADDTRGPGGRSFKVRVLLDQDPLALRPGMSVIVDLIAADLQGALVVPLDALFEENGEAVCYVRRGGRPVRQPVRLGPDDGVFCVVDGGLEEGEEVLTEMPSRAGAEPR